MQAIWKGTVSFGLVSIPVRLYAATEEKGVSFRQVHDADGGRIRYKRVCSVDGEEVPYRDIVKGYELPDGDVIVLTDDDFAALPLATKRVIDVLEFVPLEQVDGVYLSKPYFLAAETAGTKPYVLLRDALAAAGRAALVKVALRNRESLALLRPKDGALLVQTMLWPDEVRSADAFAPDEDVNVRDQEVAMAQSYIETLSGDFEPGEFTDDYRVALEELIEAKVQGREVTETPEPETSGGTVVDLMAALRASVEAAQSRRAGNSGAARSAASADLQQPGEAMAGGSPEPKTRSRRSAKAAPRDETASHDSPLEGDEATQTPAPEARKARATAKKRASSGSTTGARPGKRARTEADDEDRDTSAGTGGGGKAATKRGSTRSAAGTGAEAEEETAAPRARKAAGGTRTRKSA